MDRRELLSGASASLALTACALEAGPAGSADILQVVSEAPAVLKRGQQLIVRSRSLQRDYLIQVITPFFPPYLPGQKAAVVYALDGGQGILGPAVALLGGSDAIQPAYFVSIDRAPHESVTREREMLLGPGTRPDGSVAQGGEAKAFMDFITMELQPYIEARYPVTRSRSVLVGHSLLGIFAATMLADRPQAFSHYLIASPSYWADPGVADRLKAVKLTEPRRKVLVAYGSEEEDHMVQGGHRIARAVARNKSAFSSRERVFEGADHLSYYPQLVADGLGHLIPRVRPLRYPVGARVPVEVLRRYEGRCALSDGRTLAFEVKDEALVVKPSDRSAMTLRAFKPGHFFVNGIDLQFVFPSAANREGALQVFYNGDEALARATVLGRG